MHSPSSASYPLSGCEGVVILEKDPVNIPSPVIPIKTFAIHNCFGLGITLENYLYKIDDFYYIRDKVGQHLILEVKLPAVLNLENLPNDTYERLIGTMRKSGEWANVWNYALNVRPRADEAVTEHTPSQSDSCNVRRIKTTFGSYALESFFIFSSNSCEYVDSHNDDYFFSKILPLGAMPKNPSNEFLMKASELIRKQDINWSNSWSHHIMLSGNY